MDINEMTLEQVEERASEIDAFFNAEDTSELNLEELRSEAEALKKRKDELLEERQKIIEEIVEKKTEESKVVEKGEERKMAEKTLKEVLESREYENAYANYIKSKTNDDSEVRALLTELVEGGEVPVPSYLESKINTAWDNEELVARVNKTYVKGIIRQGIEISATDAAFHTEGANAPTEETITIGVITLTPKTIKKWISISDEVLDLTGREFLDYIYDEIEYKLAKKASEEIVAKIVALPQTHVANADGEYTSAIAQAYTSAITPSTIVMAQAFLSDEARTPVVIANKQTIAAFKSLTTTDGYLFANPFDGLTAVASNALPAYSTASAGAVYAIVGDMSAVRMNMPNGMGVQFKYDDLSLAEKDLVKIVGRMPIAVEVVADNRFVLIKKA